METFRLFFSAGNDPRDRSETGAGKHVQQQKSRGLLQAGTPYCCIYLAAVAFGPIIVFVFFTAGAHRIYRGVKGCGDREGTQEAAVGQEAVRLRMKDRSITQLVDCSHCNSKLFNE